MNPKLQQILKKNGYSLTTPRTAVFRSLASKVLPISMSELINDLSSTVNRATIYRTIEIFEKTGVVSRIQMGWKYKLELSDIFLHHHHHLTCSKCGATESFHETRKLVEELNKIGSIKGFLVKSHTLELSGVCSNCQK
jgi:Fur family transcriptional regulator, ferric uptake regulator